MPDISSENKIVQESRKTLTTIPIFRENYLKQGVSFPSCVSSSTTMSTTVQILTPMVEEAPDNTEICLEIPGRSVHPSKLTAMLRSKFGIGAYDIMVCRPKFKRCSCCGEH